MRPVVVITGASSGIGNASALALASAGFDVFAGYRNAADGAALTAQGLRALSLDVSDAQSITAAVSEVSAIVAERGVYALVNNAGVPHAGPVELMSLDALRHVFEVNVVAQVAVTQAFMPLLRCAREVAERGPRVINITSISGRVAAPFGGAYAGSKHALEAITEALRHELRPFGMWASAIEPGVFKSAFWQKGDASARASRALIASSGESLYGVTFDRYMRRFARNDALAPAPDPVARAVVRAVRARRPKRRYVVGADARAGVIARWLLPEPVFEWILRKSSGRR